jgi:Cu/Ag efflux pump CusA
MSPEGVLVSKPWSMIAGIVGWSLKYRLLVLALAAVALVLGIGQLRKMAIDVYPEFGPVVVEVQSEALGLSAEEVAEMVTVPLEADLLSNVPFVDILSSKSVPGLSSIEIVFEPGTELLKARQVVQERLAEAMVALPGASKPPQMLQPRSSMTRAMMIGLSSKDLSLIDMSVLARWNIRPRLMGIPGVANVAIWGQREQQLQVLADPDRMQARRVPLINLIETTANALWSSPLSFVEASVPGTGGFIDTPNQRIGIHHISPIKTPADLAKVAIEGRPDLRLSDVATVVEDHQPLIGDALLKSGPGLILVVEKWPNASTLDVTRRVESALAAMAPGLKGLEIDSGLYRPANYIESAVNNLTIVMVAAAALILLVLMWALFDWRSALIAAITIPVSVIATAMTLYFAGQSMNLMVVAGLAAALVLIIDDAVVLGCNLKRRLASPRPPDQSTAQIITGAFSETHGPLAFAVLIILLGLAPLFFMKGLSGAFFPPVAIAYGAAVIVSGLVAIVVAPALALILYPADVPADGPERNASVDARRRMRGYERVLSGVLGAPAMAFAATALLLLIGIGAFTQLKGGPFLPDVKERNLLIEWTAAPGVSHPGMTRVLNRTVNQLAALPGIKNVGSHVGRAITSDKVANINSGEIWLTIAPDADYDTTVKAIKSAIKDYAGLGLKLETYQQKQADAIKSATKDVVVRVYGEEGDQLSAQAEAVRSALAKIGGLSDLEIDEPQHEPSLKVQVNLAAAQKVGLKPGDVRRQATTLISGLQVGSLYQQQKVFDVVVWSDRDTRSSPSDVSDLVLDTPNGKYVRLGDVADVKLAATPAVIKRESVSRYLDVTANITGRGIDSAEDEIKAALKMMAFPIEYHAEVVTDKATGYRADRGSIAAYLIAAAIGAFLLFQAIFASWRLAFISFLTLPAALAGGAVALLITGTSLSIGAYVGFVALLGLGVRNVVTQFSRYQALACAGDRTNGVEIATSGADDNAPAVAITAIIVAVAFLPVLLAGSVPGLELIQPLAIVVLGGLVTSTLLQLFILPALYAAVWSPSVREST